MRAESHSSEVAFHASSRDRLPVSIALPLIGLMSAAGWYAAVKITVAIFGYTS